MSPQRWDKLERVVLIGIAVLGVASLILIAYSASTGQDTNQVVKGQQEDRAAAECRSSFAAADAVASARLDVAKATGIDLFLAQRAGVPLDEATFTDSHLALTSAIQVREAEALLRGITNTVCSTQGEP